MERSADPEATNVPDGSYAKADIGIWCAFIVRPQLQKKGYSLINHIRNLENIAKSHFWSHIPVLQSETLGCDHNFIAFQWVGAEVYNTLKNRRRINFYISVAQLNLMENKIPSNNCSPSMSCSFCRYSNLCSLFCFAVRCTIAIFSLFTHRSDLEVESFSPSFSSTSAIFRSDEVMLPSTTRIYTSLTMKRV